MPKMTAVINVEFELKQGQSQGVASAGGIGALKLAIERGITGTVQTAVQEGSVQANIVEQTIT